MNAGAGVKTNLLFFTRGEASARSWTVERAALEQKGYDFKAGNPNAKIEEDTRTLEQSSI